MFSKRPLRTQEHPERPFLSQRTRARANVIAKPYPRHPHHPRNRSSPLGRLHDDLDNGSNLDDRWTHLPLRPIFLRRPVHPRHAQPSLAHQHCHLAAMMDLMVDQNL